MVDIQVVATDTRCIEEVLRRDQYNATRKKFFFFVNSPKFKDGTNRLDAGKYSFAIFVSINGQPSVKNRRITNQT